MRQIKIIIQNNFNRLFIIMLVLGGLNTSTFALSSYYPVQWGKSISNAVAEREAVYSQVDITSTKTIKDIWASGGSKTLLAKLQQYSGRSSAWYYFLKGVALSGETNGQSSDNFTRAVQLIKRNPGEAWVLFNEFHSIELIDWEEKCLYEIEKSSLKQGSLSYPFIAQQLTALADSEFQKGHIDKSDRYFKWSYHFEAHPFWQDFAAGVTTIFKSPGTSIDFFKSSINTISKSWLLQITVEYYAYRWAKAVLISIMIAFFILIIMESLPVAIHPFMAKFPLSITQNLKYFMSIAILFSLAVFGVIPFLLMLIIFLWPYSKKRAFLIFNAALLLFSPIDARIMDSFRSSLSITEPAGLLRTAIYSSWSRENEVNISDAIDNNRSNHLVHLAGAILTLKKGNYQSSIYHLRNAEKIAPNDPVLLTTAGIIFSLTGDIQTSKAYFEKCIKLYPHNPYAVFNLGQLKIKSMDAAEGSDLIATAAMYYPYRINNFTTNNAKFFNNTWPRLREFLLPDYTSEYFHSKDFPKTCGSWETTDNLWGISFFGLSAKNSLFALPILFIILLNIRNKSANDIVNNCKLCGKVICRKCRNGAICKTCSSSIESTHNENVRKRIQQKIIDHRRLAYKLKSLFLNLIFPGIGTLYNREKIRPEGMFFVVITSFIYASYYAIITFNFNYPAILLKNIRVALFIIPIAYSTYFTLTSLVNIKVAISKGGKRGV